MCIQLSQWGRTLFCLRWYFSSRLPVLRRCRSSASCGVVLNASRNRNGSGRLDEDPRSTSSVALFTTTAVSVDWQREYLLLAFNQNSSLLLTLGDTEYADEEACLPLPLATPSIVWLLDCWEGCRNNGKSLATFFCVLVPLCWDGYLITNAFVDKPLQYILDVQLGGI